MKSIRGLREERGWSQFELAVKAKDGDFYQLSVAESRLKAARDELAEQKKSGGGSRPG